MSVRKEIVTRYVDQKDFLIDEFDCNRIRDYANTIKDIAKSERVEVLAGMIEQVVGELPEIGKAI